jgi:hypothetical protein
MSDGMRKALWFAALWLGGVTTLFIVAMIIRAMIF